MLVGLWINLFASPCASSMSMETDHPENSAALAVFSIKKIIENIGVYLPQQNVICELFPLYFSCKTLHNNWINIDFWSIKNPKYLNEEMREKLNQSVFIRQFLWAVCPHIEILKDIQLQYENPNDLKKTDYEPGSFLAMISSDIYAKLSIPVPINSILNSMAKIKHLETVMMNQKMGEIVFSLNVLEKMWFGELALASFCHDELQLNSYTKYFTDSPYFEGFEDFYSKKDLEERKRGQFQNSDSDSDSESSTHRFVYKIEQRNVKRIPDKPSKILRNKINSLCLYESLFHNPIIALFYGIISKIGLNIIDGYTFQTIEIDDITEYSLKHNILVPEKENWRYILNDIWGPKRKELIERAIKANINNAWEIYEHMCNRKYHNEIRGIERPIYIESPAPSNTNAGD